MPRCGTSVRARREIPAHGSGRHDGALGPPPPRPCPQDDRRVRAPVSAVERRPGIACHAGRDAPARADRDALPVRPGPGYRHCADGWMRPSQPGVPCSQRLTPQMGRSRNEGHARTASSSRQPGQDDVALAPVLAASGPPWPRPSQARERSATIQAVAQPLMRAAGAMRAQPRP